MKLTAVFLVSALAAMCGCVSVEESSKDSDRTKVTIDSERNDGFAPSERLRLSKIKGLKNNLTREGRDQKTGLSYSYEPSRSVYVTDGNARSGVQIFCRIDRMTDRKNCELSIGLSLVSKINPTGSVTSACAFMHDFPGRVAGIRVDQNPAITTGTDGCVSSGTASKILRQLRGGRSLYVESVRWPYDSRHPESTDIAGKVDLALKLWNFTNSKAMKASLFAPDN